MKIKRKTFGYLNNIRIFAVLKVQRTDRAGSRINYKTMKLLEIHKNGINAHNNEVSFYGIDFQTKTLMFDGIENIECVIEIAKELGYKISEIQMVF